MPTHRLALTNDDTKCTSYRHKDRRRSLQTICTFKDHKLVRDSMLYSSHRQRESTLESKSKEWQSLRNRPDAKYKIQRARWIPANRLDASLYQRAVFNSMQGVGVLQSEWLPLGHDNAQPAQVQLNTLEEDTTAHTST